MKIELTEEQVQNLINLLDAGVKTLGLRGAQAASEIIAALGKAREAAGPPTPEPEGD